MNANHTTESAEDDSRRNPTIIIRWIGLIAPKKCVSGEIVIIFDYTLCDFISHSPSYIMSGHLRKPSIQILN